MVMTSDETHIQFCRLANVTSKKRVTKDNRKLKSRISCGCRDKETANRQNCPAEKSLANHVKNKQHIGSEKTYGRKNNGQSKHNDVKVRKRKCCRFT